MPPKTMIVLVGRCRFQYSLSFISALMSREANKQLPTRHLSGQKLNSALYAASGPRGWRHPLLIKRMLATITPEIYNPQCVNVLRSQIEWYKKLN